MDIANKLLQLNTNLGTIDAEVSNQAGLIDEITELVNSLPEGAQLPPITDGAVAADILAGKEAVDGDGAKIIGTMPNNGAINETMDGTLVKSITIPKGYTDGGTVALDDSIDAELNEQASIIAQIREVASTLPLPLDTSDATATAAEILKDKTAYVGGQKITGKMPALEKVFPGLNGVGKLEESSATITGTSQTPCIRISGATIVNGYFKAGTTVVEAYAPLSNFGDATAADVAAGKFFTSAEGFMVEGTGSIGGASDDSIVGTWVFKDVPTFDGVVYGVPYYFDFSTSSDTYTHIIFENQKYGASGNFISYVASDDSALTAYSSVPVVWLTGGWDGEIVKTIDIKTELEDGWFKTWLKSNAIKQGSSSNLPNAEDYTF
jgi:hypothetical protein